MADYFCAWCEKAIASGIDQLVSVAQSLTDHAGGLLSYSTTGMTTGKWRESTARSKPCPDSSRAFAPTISSGSNSMPYTSPNTKLSDEAYLLRLQV
jgi:hypothetical protein